MSTSARRAGVNWGLVLAMTGVTGLGVFAFIELGLVARSMPAAVACLVATFVAQPLAGRYFTRRAGRARSTAVDLDPAAARAQAAARRWTRRFLVVSGGLAAIGIAVGADAGTGTPRSTTGGILIAAALVAGLCCWVGQGVHSVRVVLVRRRRSRTA